MPELNIWKLMWGIYLAIGWVILHAFWIGAALYAWRLWRRMRRELAEKASIDSQQRTALQRRYFKRFVLVASLWYVAGTVWFYYKDAQARQSAYNCRKSVSTEDGGLYFAERCSLAKQPWSDAEGTAGVYRGFSILVRIYSAKTGELLAEDFVANPEGSLIWRKDYAIIQGGFTGGAYAHVVELPPSRWRQFKAKFP